MLGIYELSADEAIEVLLRTTPSIFHQPKAFTTFRTMTGQARLSNSKLAGALKDMERGIMGSSLPMQFPLTTTHPAKCITYVALLLTSGQRFT
jgi:hypothetical protein